MARPRAPGWYSDTDAPGSWRWWDGGSWTGHSVSHYPSEPTSEPTGELLSQRASPEHAPATFVRRWLALGAVIIFVVVVLAIALQGHPPTLYWQGEPITNAGSLLGEARAAMQQAVKSDEGVEASQSRCYFSLPTPSAHDVTRYLRCGPVLLPWSKPSAPWLTYRLAGRLIAGGERLAARVAPMPDATEPLQRGEVLRRPDGETPPAVKLSVPVAPYQPPGWSGALSAAPAGLTAAPVGDLMGGWALSYRLIGYGSFSELPARLDKAALASAMDPPGSAWATVRGPSSGDRPLATLLLPPKGQVFFVAQLSVSPGESSGAVPVQAARATGEPAGSGAPSLQLTGAASTVELPPPAFEGTASRIVTLAASVPARSRPELEITDKGVVEEVSLADGRLGAAPQILSRPGADDPLSATGTVAGATVVVTDASLGWFAGSDGGTTPASAGDAYLQILASASGPQASAVAASDFTLQVGGGQVVAGRPLADSDRDALAVGFVVPASFSDGVVTVSAGGRSFQFPVHFA